MKDWPQPGSCIHSLIVILTQRANCKVFILFFLFCVLGFEVLLVGGQRFQFVVVVVAATVGVAGRNRIVKLAFV